MSDRARVLLGVRGMDTDAAREAVREALLALDGVNTVETSASDPQAAVEYDPGEVTSMDLIRALRRIGFLAGME